MNIAIASFNYGYLEFKNKPSVNFTEAMLSKKEHTLSQKAMQIWLLTRALPFILAGKVEEDDKYMKLLLNLIEIMGIIFAPKLNLHILPYLDEIVKNFLRYFKVLFPDINLINKFHHSTHYADFIKWSGPLVHFYCMRFEANHGIYKLRAQNIHSFKNPPKTLARIGQTMQCYKWSTGEVEVNKLEVLSGTTKFVCHAASRHKLLAMGFKDSDQVFCATEVKVNGRNYRKKLFVLLEKETSRDDDYHLFGQIEEIIVLKDTVYLLTLICNTVEFDPLVHAYQINTGYLDEFSAFVEVSKLPINKTYCYWTKPNSDNMYISLRHIVL